MISALLAPRSARFLSVLALAGCAASRPRGAESPAPNQAIRILAAARTPGSARVTIALAEPAHVTVFSVVPGEAVGLLRPSGEGAVEVAPALGAGSKALSLVAAGGAAITAPHPSGGTYLQDRTTYESCIAQVMAITFNQSVPDRQAALDNPYYRCPDRPAPAAAPAPRPAYVLVVTTSGAPDAGRLMRDLGDLDLSGSIATLSERVGAIVARSAGEAGSAFASATSRW